jgi:hypothetical protein
MIYEVEKCPERIPLDLLDRAVLFATRFLDIECKNLVIEFKRLKKHQRGFCDYDDEEVTITISSGLSCNESMTTLFHEMVHVKQHMDGRLKNGYIWLGKTYDCSYDELPWEQEAYQLENEMIKDFKNE